MQFGGGNFLRAFVDWMLQVLNEETNFNGGVVIIKPTERGDYSELKLQNGLFTVVLDGIQNGQLIAEKKLVECVQEIINPYNDWDVYLGLAKNPALRFVVSNTTEAGIKFSKEDLFEHHPPKEFPAKLSNWLYQRFIHFKGHAGRGCIFLPCELIEHNGEKLKESILQYADHWALGNDFKTWIQNANYFCSTLVDRIVSGYPSDRAPDIEKELGYRDPFLVAGEYYHSWVIQAPALVKDELPFSKTKLNVIFVDDLDPYRQMKVRILNGAHTAMVPVAYLCGIRYVKDAMENVAVAQFVEDLLIGEAAKTLNFPETEKRQFVLDVLDRFRNPLLQHQLISISLNSTSKFVARLLPVVKDYQHDQGKLPNRIVFALAALILFYKGSYSGAEIDLKDNLEVLAIFDANWKKKDAGELTTQEFTKNILGNTTIWSEDLTQIEGMVEEVSKNIANIEKHGIQKTMIALIQRNSLV